MTNFDRLFKAKAMPVCQRQFGEWILYRPLGGIPRQIFVIVNRQPIAPVRQASGARTPFIEIEAVNDPRTGIDSALLNTGGDRVDVSFRDGDPVSIRSITKFLKGIAGVTRFEVQ